MFEGQEFERPHIAEPSEPAWPRREIEAVISYGKGKIDEQGRPISNRIDPHTFLGIYSEKEILDDETWVHQKREEHRSLQTTETEARAEKIGEALEAILEQGVEEFGWFSAGSVTAHYVRTAKYDDYKGIDGVLEFSVKTQKGGVHRIALAVDASLNRKTEAIEKKIHYSTKRVLGRKDAQVDGPAVVKYFHSKADPHTKGKLEGVVPVVVGVDSADCFKLIKQLAQLRELERSAKSSSLLGQKHSEAKNRMKEHPAQMIFLKEIELQLTRYLALIDSPAATEPTVKKKDLEAIKGVIAYIRGIKRKQGATIQEMSNDAVMQVIERITGKVVPEEAYV